MNSMQENKTTNSAYDYSAAEETESSVSGYDLRREKWVVARKSKKKSKAKKRVEGSDVVLNKPDKENMKSRCQSGKKACDVSTSGKDCITCDVCKQTFHEQCQGLCPDAHAAVKKYKLFWVCTECKQELVTMKEERHNPVAEHVELRIAEAESKIISALKEATGNEDPTKQLEDRMNEMEKSFSELKEQQIRVEMTIKEHKEAVQKMPQVSEEIKQSADQLQKIFQSKDKENREQNVIVHNIPESASPNVEERKQYDLDSFFNIAYALMGDEAGRVEVEAAVRVGKKREQSSDNENDGGPKARLMLVKLKSKKHANILFRYRTRLKDAGFPNVYLTKDMTAEEREKQRNLREELARVGRDKYTIFRGEIVPRN